METGAYSTKKKRQTIIRSADRVAWDDLEDFIEKCKQRATANTKKMEPFANTLETLWRDAAAATPVGTPTPTKQTRQTGPALVNLGAPSPLPIRKGIWSWDEINEARQKLTAMRR